VYVHSYWVRDGVKMSKSLGNFIDIDTLHRYAAWSPNKDALPLGVDALRWFLATQGPLSGADTDFSIAKLVEVYNADLANGVGNCASRVGNMIEKYFDGVVPDPRGATAHTPAGHTVFDFAVLCDRALQGAIDALAEFRIDAALQQGIWLVGQVDLFINHTRPFTMAKEMDKVRAEGDSTRAAAMREELGRILYLCAEAVRIASLLVAPAMPEKMNQLWRTWGCLPPTGVALADLAAFGGSNGLQPGAQIAKGGILFMRADPKVPPPSSPV